MPTGVYERVDSEDLFWSKVKKTPGCWVWQAGVDEHGYGEVRVKGRKWKAHRYAYTILVGPIPRGRHVLHTCDNRLCIKPDHLWLGTNASNNQDRHNKGRDAVGERQGNAKLTKRAIRDIRRRLALRLDTVNCLASEYGVDPTTIRNVNARRFWQHVA
jgi:hypothetical protein